MLHLILLSVTLLGVDDPFASRLQTLSFHIERLDAVTVPDALLMEKQEKLEALKKRVGEGADSEEAFNALYIAIDEARMWLWENAAARPERAPGEFSDTADCWEVTTPALRLQLQKEDLAVTVHTAGHAWRFLPSDNSDIQFIGRQLSFTEAADITVLPFHTGYSAGLTACFKGFPGNDSDMEIRLTAHIIANEIVFDLAMNEQHSGLIAVNWPKAIETGNTDSDFAVIPRMQGMLLPGNWPQPINAEDLSNSRSFYLPWWGQIQDGHGVLTLLETDDDAGGAYQHPAGGPTRVAPRWYASLGRMRYMRSIRYIFDDEATYVSMAKRYRRFVIERGHFVSLREKLLRTPALAEVIGKPVAHLGSLYHFVQEASLFNKERIENNHALQTFDQLAEQLRTLKSKGIENAYVHLDGWGFYGYDNGHPDVLPVGEEQGGWDGLRRFAETCKELGYLFAVHDQYRDFYLNALSFDDRLTATRLDGSREEHSVWCGGPQTILSPRFSPEYVRRNHDLFAAHGVQVRGAYLDVFSVVPLEESAQPAHPVTRSDCARYRRECFDLLRARGYVVSSEEPTEYLTRSLALVHHAPYATYPNIGGGDACGIPVPLYSLVYHDSILIPWEMGDDGGWGIPKGDAAYLHCLLNAGLPYVWPGYDEEAIKRVLEAAALAAHCAHLEMTHHEFLDEGRREQRVTYSDGTQVTVNFNTKNYYVVYGK